ncbi:hypothetical protein KC723_00050 [Candidatus Kaiserbacteria bacterium]|nr:hypothetical protein [Candidatus Kaiserbacteria bacterium]
MLTKFCCPLFILTVGGLGLYTLILNDLNKSQLSETETKDQSNITDSIKRFKPDILFDDYRNSDRYLAGARTLSEISEAHITITESYEKFPNWAGYYAPLSVIHNVKEIDIDNDGNYEQIIYYSCIGCNTLPRNIDIIKDNRIIFTAEGGQLGFANVDDLSGFVIYSALLPRGTGERKIQFRQSSSGEYHPESEEEIYY